jgi:hypothetical protein
MLFLKNKKKTIKPYKKSFIKKINKQILKNSLSLYNFENIIFNFLKIVLVSNKNFFLKNKKNANLIYIYYFNSSSFLLHKFGNFNNNFYLFILDLRKKKPYINIIVRKQNTVSLSVGVVLKYLKIKEKKFKKKTSSLYLMLKIVLTIIYKDINFKKKNIFEIKGLRKDIYLIIKFIKTNIFLKNLILIYTPNLIGKSLKYKKIKAIKKNLKKKLIKID